MNWGIKIIVVLSLFISGIGYMIYVCVKQKDIQLVASDYYEQEIAYQHIIDEQSNYNNLAHKPVLEQKEDAVIFDMSAMDDAEKFTGTLYFFRPSQSGMDLKINIKPDSTGKQTIDTGSMSKGKWVLKLSLEDGNKKYYNEEVIFIQ